VELKNTSEVQVCSTLAIRRWSNHPIIANEEEAVGATWLMRAE